MRRIKPRFVVIWGTLAVLFSVALLAPDAVSWWASAATLAWFGIWETKGIVSPAKGDTLSESVWTILQVKDGKPVNIALVPLVAGVFWAAAVLFIGLVDGSATLDLATGWRVGAATAVAAGTLGFLAFHFWTGGNTRPKR